MRREKIVIILTSIITLTIFTLSFPLSNTLIRKNQVITTSQGNILNKNNLNVSLNPKIEGIRATSQGNKITLAIPFFLQERFLTKKNYRKLKINSNLPLLLTMLPILLLSKTSLLDSFAIFTFSILIKLNIKNLYKLGIITLTLAIILTTGVSTTKDFNYSLIVNNKVALSAIKMINSPSAVPLAIKYTEKNYTLNNTLDLPGCHQSLHQLGMITYLKFNNSIKALQYATTSCEFGYLHGVEDGISLLTTNVLNSQQHYQEGCNIIYTGKNENTLNECIHGSGHAFFDLYDGDYSQAYLACQIWKEKSGVCESAVTMSLGDFHQYKQDNIYLPELCLTIEIKTAKISCLLNSFRYEFLTQNSLPNDILSASKFCNKTPLQLQTSCFSGMGEGISFLLKSKLTVEEKSWGEKYCSLANVLNKNCFFSPSSSSSISALSIFCSSPAAVHRYILL